MSLFIVVFLLAFKITLRPESAVLPIRSRLLSLISPPFPLSLPDFGLAGTMLAHWHFAANSECPLHRRSRRLSGHATDIAGADICLARAAEAQFAGARSCRSGRAVSTPSPGGWRIPLF